VDFSEARELFGIIFQFWGPLYETLDCGLISKKPRGLFAKFLKLPIFRFNFQQKIPWTVDRVGSWWTANRGCSGASPARERWSLPVLTGDGGGGRASRAGAREVLTSDRAVATRRRTEGNEWRWLELITRVEEGAKKLGREGMRCGEGRGVSSLFYKGRGAPERGGWGE
jgi:hypothetical protein